MDNSPEAGPPVEPGWLDGEPPQEPNPVLTTPGARLLLDLPKKFVPDLRAVAELAPHADALLAHGWTAAELGQKLTGGAAKAKNPPGVVVHRLRAIPVPMDAEEDLVDGAGASVPPLCGECDAQPGDPVSGRVEWLDERRTTSTPCPRCHPRMVMAHAAG